MTPTYDEQADALYIRANTQTIARQVEMPDGVIVDVDSGGHLVGIEIISPSAGWHWNDIVDRFHLDAPQDAFLRLVASIPWGDNSFAAARPGRGGQQADPADSLVA